MAHILVVDDDRDLCALLRTALERDGHQVSTRLSGGQVDEAACRWADCILLDVMMPGEDGFATCRRVRGLAGGRRLPDQALPGGGAPGPGGGPPAPGAAHPPRPHRIGLSIYNIQKTTK